MQRVVASLVEQNLIAVHQFTATDRDQKNWYSIEYENLNVLTDRIAFDHANMASSIRPKRRHGSRQLGGMDNANVSSSDHANMASSSIKGSETSSEITSETTTEKPPFGGGEFLSTLENFERHRKEIRKPLKPTGRKALYVQLQRMGESVAVAAMQTSIANGWQGVFEPNGTNGSHSKNNNGTSGSDYEFKPKSLTR